MLLHPLLKRIQKQLMADLNLYFEIIHNLVDRGHAARHRNAELEDARRVAVEPA